MLGQMKIELVQALRPIHRREHVDKAPLQRQQPTAAASFGDNAVDGDLVRRHPCSVCHRIDEGGLDPAPVAVEGARGGIECDDRRDPLRVCALVALVAPAVEQG